MGETPSASTERTPGFSVGVRLLAPETTKVFSGTFSLLHCLVEGDGLYRGVFAVMLFPVSYPDRFISLCYHDLEDKIREIGVIAELEAFPVEQQELVRASLKKHYYEKIVTRVHSVRCEYGLLIFDVLTRQGAEQFMVPWRHDRALDFGASGKVLLDAHDNRYVIPDLFALPPADRRRFTNYIYW
jgi:hypothetical protein